jgi:hypothetical protein
MVSTPSESRSGAALKNEKPMNTSNFIIPSYSLSTHACFLRKLNILKE